MPLWTRSAKKPKQRDSDSASSSNARRSHTNDSSMSRDSFSSPDISADEDGVETEVTRLERELERRAQRALQREEEMAAMETEELEATDEERAVLREIRLRAMRAAIAEEEEERLIQAEIARRAETAAIHEANECKKLEREIRHRALEQRNMLSREENTSPSERSMDFQDSDEHCLEAGCPNFASNSKFRHRGFCSSCFMKLFRIAEWSFAPSTPANRETSLHRPSASLSLSLSQVSEEGSSGEFGDRRRGRPLSISTTSHLSRANHKPIEALRFSPPMRPTRTRTATTTGPIRPPPSTPKNRIRSGTVTPSSKSRSRPPAPGSPKSAPIMKECKTGTESTGREATTSSPSSATPTDKSTRSTGTNTSSTSTSSGSTGSTDLTSSTSSTSSTATSSTSFTGTTADASATSTNQEPAAPAVTVASTPVPVVRAGRRTETAVLAPLANLTHVSPVVSVATTIETVVATPPPAARVSDVGPDAQSPDLTSHDPAAQGGVAGLLHSKAAADLTERARARFSPMYRNRDIDGDHPADAADQFEGLDAVSSLQSTALVSNQTQDDESRIDQLEVNAQIIAQGLPSTTELVTMQGFWESIGVSIVGPKQAVAWVARFREVLSGLDILEAEVKTRAERLERQKQRTKLSAENVEDKNDQKGAPKDLAMERSSLTVVTSSPTRPSLSPRDRTASGHFRPKLPSHIPPAQPLSPTTSPRISSRSSSPMPAFPEAIPEADPSLSEQTLSAPNSPSPPTSSSPDQEERLLRFLFFLLHTLHTTKLQDVKCVCPRVPCVLFTVRVLFGSSLLETLLPPVLTHPSPRVRVWALKLLWRVFQLVHVLPSCRRFQALRVSSRAHQLSFLGVNRLNWAMALACPLHKEPSQQLFDSLLEILIGRTFLPVPVLPLNTLLLPSAPLAGTSTSLLEVDAGTAVDLFRCPTLANPVLLQSIFWRLQGTEWSLRVSALANLYAMLHQPHNAEAVMLQPHWQQWLLELVYDVPEDSSPFKNIESLHGAKIFSASASAGKGCSGAQKDATDKNETPVLERNESEESEIVTYAVSFFKTALMTAVRAWSGPHFGNCLCATMQEIRQFSGGWDRKSVQFGRLVLSTLLVTCKSDAGSLSLTSARQLNALELVACCLQFVLFTGFDSRRHWGARGSFSGSSEQRDSTDLNDIALVSAVSAVASVASVSSGVSPLLASRSAARAGVRNARKERRTRNYSCWRPTPPYNSTDYQQFIGRAPDGSRKSHLTWTNNLAGRLCLHIQDGFLADLCLLESVLEMGTAMDWQSYAPNLQPNWSVREKRTAKLANRCWVFCKQLLSVLKDCKAKSSLEDTLGSVYDAVDNTIRGKLGRRVLSHLRGMTTHDTSVADRTLLAGTLARLSRDNELLPYFFQLSRKHLCFNKGEAMDRTARTFQKIDVSAVVVSNSPFEKDQAKRRPSTRTLQLGSMPEPCSGQELESAVLAPGKVFQVHCPTTAFRVIICPSDKKLEATNMVMWNTSDVTSFSLAVPPALPAGAIIDEDPVALTKHLEEIRQSKQRRGRKLSTVRKSNLSRARFFRRKTIDVNKAAPVDDDDDDNDHSYPFQIATPSESFVVVAKSRRVREEWMAQLQRMELKKSVGEGLLDLSPHIFPFLDDNDTPTVEEEEEEGDEDEEEGVDLEALALSYDVPNHHLHRSLSVAPVFVPPKSATRCAMCTKAFSLLKRKFNCSNCGLVFCSACCRHTYLLPHISPVPQRVCEACNKSLHDKKQARQRMQEAMVKYRGSIDYSVRMPSERKKKTAGKDNLIS